IARFAIDPIFRSKTRISVSGRKLLAFDYTRGSHGRIWYDLGKFLYTKGTLIDVLPWNVPHSADKINALSAFYDSFIASPDGVHVLMETYRVPRDKVILISHSEFD